jgi:flavodoxin/NAD-dependent dihydropyrimidine dehydrogenase PreA subunit
LKIIFVTFSQTGNTQKVAQAMADTFREEGHSIRMVALKNASPEDVLDCDLLGVGAPCFNSQAPTPIKDFLRKLPEIKNRPCFVVLYDLSSLLKGKGAKVVGGIIIRAECFHPVPCLYGRFPGRPNSNDLKQAKDFAKVVADHVSQGRSEPLPESRADAFKIQWGFYDFVAYILSDPFTRFSMPKPKLVSDLCTECGWCAQECPTNSIISDPKPVIDKSCIRCYLCLTGCPEKAFKVNWLVSNIAVWSFYNTIFERWFGDVKPGEKIY